MRSYAKKIRNDASVDFLSGLLNRRAVYMLAERLRLTAKRFEWRTSVALIDIDYFKRVNDNYGQETGGEAIKHISNLIDKLF
jgi:diguanylate cyclase (GGDEF)-like protein